MEIRVGLLMCRFQKVETSAVALKMPTVQIAIQINLGIEQEKIERHNLNSR